jgi:hypothetical protein
MATSNAVQRACPLAPLPRVRGAFAWLITALVSALGASVSALDTVNVTTIKPKAFESDPVNGQGQFIITRTGSLGTVVVQFSLGGTASYGADYSLTFNPRGDAAARTVTFQPGETSATVNIVAIADGLAELGQTVILTVIAQPSYVVGNRQIDVVTIIDADITARTLVDKPIAEELLPPTPPQIAVAPPARTREWFENPISVYFDRGVEVILGGTAAYDTDYSLVWKIGGGISGAEGLTERASNGFAYRIKDEYGNAKGPFTSILVSGGTDFPIDARNKRMTKVGGQTGVWNIDTMTATANGVRIDFNPGINFDIAQGAGVTLACEVDLVTPTGNSVVTRTITDWQVDNPIMFAALSTSVSVVDDPSKNFGALYVGDLIQFAGDTTQFYRITGPQNVGNDRSASHPSGNLPVNLDHNPLAIPSAAAGPSAFITFVPPLRTAILRAGNAGKIITHFPTTMAQSRETVLIPGLPTAPSPVYPKEYPNDMPRGDYVDWYLTPADDAAAEGAETITLTIQTGNANNGYDILDPTVGTMLIADNDVVASIEAVQNATEAGLSGLFKVTLTQAFPAGKNVTIPYVLTTQGLANAATVDGAGKDFSIAGFDTATMRGSIVVLGGSKEAFITVVPIDDTATEGNEQIKVTLGDSYDYLLAGSVSGDVNANGATMNIADAVGKLSVAAIDARTVEGSSAPGLFRISLARNPGQTQALSVDFRISGSATGGRDYQVIGGPIVIPDGMSSVDVTVQALADTAFDPEETVVLTLQGSAGLIDSASASATVTIGEGTASSSSTRSAAVVEQNGSGGCGNGSGLALLGALSAFLGLRTLRARSAR